MRYDGEGRPPVTDGPFAETKDLIAGYVIDVESWDRAVQLAGKLSAAPGPGGEPSHEWLEVRPFSASHPRSPSERIAAAGTRSRGDRRPVFDTWGADLPGYVCGCRRPRRLLDQAFASEVCAFGEDGLAEVKSRGVVFGGWRVILGWLGAERR